ncbi:MAG: type II toxin-antitoxin system HicB family antitoxin [Magnetococcales bacterium]|nr:type II toxin-antitoxin system HicB family antitoxin [Magnetococcales bacterium]
MKNLNISKMLYHIAIEPGDQDHAFGVVVPDLPGCHSAGDTLEEALANAKEAIEGHLEVLLEEGMTIPEKQPVAVHAANSDYTGWLWAVVEVEDLREKFRAVRVNITLPPTLLTRIDKMASIKRMSRSGFLANAAKQALLQSP